MKYSPLERIKQLIMSIKSSTNTAVFWASTLECVQFSFEKQFQENEEAFCDFDRWKNNKIAYKLAGWYSSESNLLIFIFVFHITEKWGTFDQSSFKDFKTENNSWKTRKTNFSLLRKNLLDLKTECIQTRLSEEKKKRFRRSDAPPGSKIFKAISGK